MVFFCQEVEVGALRCSSGEISVDDGSKTMVVVE